MIEWRGKRASDDPRNNIGAAIAAVSAASPWADGRVVDRTKALYLDGKSATQIVLVLRAEFNVTVTRNAVIGLLHRHKITRGVEARATSVRLGSAQSTRPPKKAAGPPLPPVSKPLPPPRADSLKPQVASLLDLGPHACRWPYGEVDFHFRGRASPEGSSYCDSHAAVARSPFQPSKKELPKTPKAVTGSLFAEPAA